MKAFYNPRVLVINDAQGIRETLTGMIRGWGLSAEGISPEAAPESIWKNSCDIILLDVPIYNFWGLDLMPQFGSDSKIIVMTESGDKEAGICALRRGAFDLVEKPFPDELLYHSVMRALKAVENERKTKRLIEDLERSHSLLLAHKLRLEKLNEQLLDTNRALSVFAQNVERERGELERRIALKLREILLPIVARMRDDRALREYDAHLEMLTRQIEDLTSGFPIERSFAMTLSSTETRVAYLIKYGIGTEEIGRQLHISENTVRTHRKNIRKKLKINAQYSLKNYLNSKNGAFRQDQSVQSVYADNDLQQAYPWTSFQ
jgi:FixJ family two-component response regulator